jgi:hypothetical protein
LGLGISIGLGRVRYRHGKRGAARSGTPISRKLKPPKKSLAATGRKGNQMSPILDHEAPEIIGGYEVHPTASLFPSWAGSDCEELKKSLADHGQQEPVRIQNGVLIDGRNRLKILRELGRPVAFHHYDGELTVE